MSKGTRLIKRVATLFLVLLLSIESFGAVVSDNDGSAFITKAEFDSLKNTFQAQIDTYNTSIDSKIDGAIAHYLAGIRVSSAPTNRWSMLVDSMGQDLWFANSVSATGKYETTAGSNTNTAQLFVNASRHYTYRYSTFTTGWHAWNSMSGKRLGLEFGIWPSSKSVPSDSWSSNSYKYVQVKTDKSNATDSADLLSTSLGGFSNGGGGWTENYKTNNVNAIFDSSATNNDGSGNGWVYHKRGDGELILREYCTKICPGQVIDSQWHTYKNMTVGTAGWSKYTTADGLSDTTSGPTITVEAATTWGVKSSGSKKADDSTTANSEYWKRNQFKVSSSNTKDYSVLQWGSGCRSAIYCFADDIAPTSGTVVSISIPEGKWDSLYFTNNGIKLGTSKANGYTLKYTPLKFTPESKYIYNFVNDYISASAGEIVYLGGGAPILETTSAGQEVEVKIRFKMRNAGSHDAANGNVDYVISNKQFNKGSVASGAKTLASGTASTSTEVTHKILVEKKGTLWINLYSTASGYEATISSISVR